MEINGTASHLVVLTSSAVTKAPGQWSRLLFYGGSTGSISYCRVEYGGVGNNADQGMIRLEPTASVVIDNCWIQHASRVGLWANTNSTQSVTATITNCHFVSNQEQGSSGNGPAVDVGGADGKSPNFTMQNSEILNTTNGSNTGMRLRGNQDPALVTITGNTFQNNHEGITGGLDAVSRVTLGGNTYMGNGFNGIVISDGTLSTNGTLSLDGGPYGIVTSPAVGAGGLLTINAGVVLQFNASQYLVMNQGNPGGKLIINGTIDKRVVLTSSSDTKAAGQWNRILFYGGSSGVMNYCAIEYGGGGSYGDEGMIRLEPPASLSMDNCWVQYASQVGLWANSNPSNGSTAMLTNCHFVGNQVQGASGGGPAVDVGSGSGQTVNFTMLNGEIRDTKNGLNPGLRLRGNQVPASVVMKGTAFSNNLICVKFEDNTAGARITCNTFSLASNQKGIQVNGAQNGTVVTSNGFSSIAGSTNEPRIYQ